MCMVERCDRMAGDSTNPLHLSLLHPTMRPSNIRRQIASAAARLIAEEGMRDYGMAKRKAARQLGVGPNEELPTNAEIEEAVRDYQAIYFADEQPEQLRALRSATLDLMVELDRFKPYATGGVVDGTAGRFSAIELQVFADSAKEVEVFLLNNGVDFDSRDPRRPDRNSPETTLLFDWDDLPVELSVFPAGLERSRSRERMRAESLRALLDKEEETE